MRPFFLIQKVKVLAQYYYFGNKEQKGTITKNNKIKEINTKNQRMRVKLIKKELV